MAQSLYRKASLVMNPYGAKDDLLPSIKPTDGSGDFTFSRDGAGASPATRVNASGLIEKGRTNEVLQSNSFDTTWLNAASTETGGQAGYDGTNDAWLLEKTGATGHIYQTLSSSGVLTLSVYAKAGSRDWMRVIATGGSSTPSTWFDLANGVVGTADFFTIDSNIESVGGGWYRCSITFEVGSINGVRFYPAEGNNDISGTSGNIYIQDAQLESGLVATEYIETTTAAVSAGLLGDMPRLDYSGGATCPSLLLEPSRTNIHTNSEYLDAYVKSRATITSNAATSPEGVSNASKIIPLSTSTGWAGVNAPNYSFTSGQTYTLSVFAKAGEYNYCQVGGSTPAFNGSFATINLTNGVVEHESGITATTEDYGNGWWRIYFTHTAIATASSPIGFLAVYSTAVSSRLATQVGDDVSGIYAYGWMAELGSYPTSYIPTYGSASTRGADNCENTSASSIIGQTEGTLYAEVDFDAISEESRFVQISDGTNNNRMYIGVSSTNTINLYLFSGGAGLVSIFSSAYTSQVVKVAAAYANNDFVLYVNGTQIGTDTTGSVPAMDEISIGYNNIANNRYTAYGTKQAVLFPTRLTNAELAALTA